MIHPKTAYDTASCFTENLSGGLVRAHVHRAACVVVPKQLFELFLLVAQLYGSGAVVLVRHPHKAVFLQLAVGGRDS